MGKLPASGSINVGELKLSVSDDLLTVYFSPPEPSDKSLVVNIAWLGFDLKSNVDAGENRGRQLANDFIVLDMTQLALRREQGAYVARLNQPLPQLNVPRTAIAAWVARKSSLVPLQAVGGWLSVNTGQGDGIGF